MPESAAAFWRLRLIRFCSSRRCISCWALIAIAGVLVRLHRGLSESSGRSRCSFSSPSRCSSATLRCSKPIWNGQTPGKRWTHLRVIQDSGRPITAYDSVLRNLLRIVDALPTLYAMGIVTMLISRENKRVGDYAAGTVVIHEKPLQGIGAIWKRGGGTGASRCAAILSAQLTLDELQLVETFFERRTSLDPEVRRAMARQIAQRLGERLNVPSEVRPDAERFLEALAEQRRPTEKIHE